MLGMVIFYGVGSAFMSVFVRGNLMYCLRKLARGLLGDISVEIRVERIYLIVLELIKKN